LIDLLVKFTDNDIKVIKEWKLIKENFDDNVYIKPLISKLLYRIFCCYNDTHQMNLVRIDTLILFLCCK